MKVRFLDGERFRNAFVAGTMALERRREHLNSINVFPVPDGDTGNNMAATCRCIAERTVVSKSISVTAASMAEAALAGARGNSGIIFCQYLYGLSQSLRRQTAPDAHAFAESLVAAVPYAEEALHTPVEGTILTVMRDWAKAVSELSRSVADFAVLLPSSLSAAKASLLETPRKLEVLAREKVVDAGAQGFVDFLEGIAEFIERGSLKHIVLPKVSLPPEHVEEHPHDEMPEHRYCTEAILEGGDFSRTELLEELSSYGDSVVVGGGEGRYRIHLHTDRPAELFERLARRGTLNEQKVDDMRRQVETKTHRLSPIALVTDSSCDLPPELLDRYRIHTLPLKLSFGGSTYLDKATIHPAGVYRILRETRNSMTTSQPGFTEFSSLYSFLAAHHDAVVAVHLSAALSGTWSASSKAAASVDKEKIRVLDSRTLCSSLGLLVLKAAEAIEEGKSSEEVVEIVERAVPRTRIFAGLSTLEYMVRGGRIRPIAGFVAGLLRLVPIITVDSQGRGTHYGKPGTERSNRKKIIAAFKELVDRRGLWKYAVVHADAREKAEHLAAELAEFAGGPPAYIMEISPVIGINSGPGSIAVSMILEN